MEKGKGVKAKKKAKKKENVWKMTTRFEIWREFIKELGSNGKQSADKKTGGNLNDKVDEIIREDERNEGESMTIEKEPESGVIKMVRMNSEEEA